MIGVAPTYSAIHNLRLVEGEFFNAGHNTNSASVCVLGQGARTNLLGYEKAVGKYVKVNDNWLEVVGVLGESIAATGKSSGGKMEDLNNVIYIPAALLEQQRRTQIIFTYVMVAIAAISLLVGGIGIMNIVLATVIERHQGDRRAARDRCAASRHRAAVSH